MATSVSVVARVQKIRYECGFRDAIRDDSLLVLVNLGLAALLLVLSRGSVGGDGALDLCGLSNTLALLGLLVVLGDLRSVVGVVVGHALLLAGHVVEALGGLARVGLW